MADEIKRLERALEKLTRRADEEKMRADEAKLRADEAKLRVDEAKLRVDEAKLRAHEERCLREHAEQNTADINAALLREREEHNKMTLDQPLEDYLKRVHVMYYHLPHLLPPPGKVIPTLSEGHPSKSIYPLHIREWTGFPELCQQQFGRIRDALGTQRLFPSVSDVDYSEKRLLEDFPKAFVESESFLSASKLSFFLHETLERPVQHIMNAFLRTSGHKPQLYFDCHSADWLVRYGGTSSVYPLKQTFHYMVTSGLEFGCMAAGESLLFLRIPRDDATTLLYYTQVVPKYCRAAGASKDSNHTASDAADDFVVNIDELAIARLCGLSLLAFESPAAPPQQVSTQVLKVAQSPELPLSLSTDSVASSPTNPPSGDSSSEGRRRRRDERDNDDEEGDDSGRRGRTMTHRPRNPSSLKRQSSAPGQQRSDADGAFRAKLANSSQPGHDRCRPSLPSPFDPVSFKPIRPYCTHLCLRSLVQGDDSVDHDCPNVFLHLEAARRIGGPAADRDRHPIGPAKFTELVQLQLLNNVEQDCECLIRYGLYGAIGCLFRVTVTGFGYTLVAKGVQKFHARRLRHEAVVYKQLAAQQGILIPVCVGMVKLRLPYVTSNYKLITHMLLLSYAGTLLDSPALRRRLEAAQVDIDAEASRTLEELQALGVDDDDDASNGELKLTWCAGACRVMKIDFDHARMRKELSAPDKKRPADGPPPVVWYDECRQKKLLQQQRHLTVASLLLA